jgi:hypothetical protein
MSSRIASKAIGHLSRRTRRESADSFVALKLVWQIDTQKDAPSRRTPKRAPCARETAVPFPNPLTSRRGDRSPVASTTTASNRPYQNRKIVLTYFSGFR